VGCFYREKVREVPVFFDVRFDFAIVDGTGTVRF
jgi:hypothetical protein